MDYLPLSQTQSTYSLYSNFIGESTATEKNLDQFSMEKKLIAYFVKDNNHLFCPTNYHLISKMWINVIKEL